MTDQPLTEVVSNLAENDAELSDLAKLAILGALESSESLAEALGTKTGTAVTPPVNRPIEPEPVGAFLTSIEVAGFRGIGPRAKLNLQPGPGLTIVAGRNGSGKSSFAEALELALTGDSYRWLNKAAVWLGAWRNIHEPVPCEIRIGLAEEGEGTTTIGLDWTKDGELGDRISWMQRAGMKREPGLANLGWTSALERYRPILSYDELSGLLEGQPKELFDSVEKLLGMEPLQEAQKRLAVILKELQKPETQAKATKAQLMEALESIDDERATAAVAQVKKMRPDLGVLVKLATGTSPQPSGELTSLRTLALGSVPNRELVEETVRELRSAVGLVADQSDRSLALAESRTTLLAQAVDLHTQHGDMACPVCGDGALDQAWHTRVDEELARDNADLKRLRDAHSALRQRRGNALELVRSTVGFTAPESVGLDSLQRAQVARERWAATPAGDSDLAEHILSTYSELASAAAELRAEATAALDEREDTWAPVAQQLATWVELKQAVQAQSGVTKAAKLASDWFKKNVAALRNHQVEPLADGARDIWARLRQESNVGLGAITMQRSGDVRSVQLVADVDGQETRALSVMSRGELHALALALFLPRATMKASPLRFVVLDDPVQAMDPAKVDGFAQVLREIAKERQVVVFSHDDRLAEAVRRFDPSARVAEVTRGVKSEVRIADSRTPTNRYIEDARAFANDPKVRPEVKLKTLPGLGRLALEAAALEVFQSARYNDGHDRISTEEAWSGAKSLSKKLALALYGDSEKDLSSWRHARIYRKATLGNCIGGVHLGVATDPRGAVNDLRRTVADLLGTR